MTVPILRRYVIREDHPLEGWAIIVVGDDGFFAAVSDFGNYAFQWTAMGCSAREFFTRMDRDPHYFMGKLAQGRRDYFGERTEKNVRRRICELRRCGELDAETAREEWDRLAEYGHFDHSEDFSRWVYDSKLFDSSDFGGMCERAELAVYGLPSDLLAFGERVMPRFAALLRAEVAAEKAARGAEAAQW